MEQWSRGVWGGEAGTLITPQLHDSNAPRPPWPLESGLHGHLLCFRQACRLTTPSSAIERPVAFFTPPTLWVPQAVIVSSRSGHRIRFTFDCGGDRVDFRQNMHGDREGFAGTEFQADAPGRLVTVAHGELALVTDGRFHCGPFSFVVRRRLVVPAGNAPASSAYRAGALLLS